MELNAAGYVNTVEVECAKCECCGLEEDCTGEYIGRVKAEFDGKWLCGLCEEAVRDEAEKRRGRKKGTYGGVDEALAAHMSFCRSVHSESNPAIHVVDGMRQMLRRRSVDMPPAAADSRRSGKLVMTSQIPGVASALPLR